MANLLGQDIGLNYKGLINIGSTINQNISASLQSLTDGDGNLLPLQISTTQISVGGATGTGRLIVRGDGTNPIFRAEHSDGTSALIVTHTVNGVGLQTSGSWTAYNNSTSNLVGIQGGVFYVANPSSRFQIALNTGEARLAGNMFVGGIAVTPTARLHVRGDGTNPIFRFETTGGVNALSLDATGANLNFNPGLVTAAMELRATHYISLKFYNNYNQFTVGPLAVAGSPLYVQNYIQTVNFASFGSIVGTEHYAIGADMPFSPSTGSNNFAAFRYVATINQTGTANGITRGLFINPTLTSAVDFRGIEVKAGSTPAHKLLLLTDGSGNKVFEVNGKQQIGFYGASPADKPEVLGARSNPEEALNNLLSALATLGLITNSTTA